MQSKRNSINDLAKACAVSADAAEWGEFLRLCTPLASMVAIRASRLWGNGASSVADDIVQEIFLKLCEQERRILREFEPRGEDSFLGLLRTISASVANDYFRRLRSAKRGGNAVIAPLAEDGAPQPAASRSLPTSQFEDQHRSVLLSQLDSKLRSAPEMIGERDRALFWLYYLQGMTAEEIARVSASGLTPKGVESALRRVAKWLRTEISRKDPEEQPDSG